MHHQITLGWYCAPRHYVIVTSCICYISHDNIFTSDLFQGTLQYISGKARAWNGNASFRE